MPCGNGDQFIVAQICSPRADLARMGNRLLRSAPASIKRRQIARAGPLKRFTFLR